MWQRGGQWQTGGVLDTQHWVTWQNRRAEEARGQWQTRGGVLDAQHQVMWQRVDQGRPRRSMLGDVAKRSVQGQWQTGGDILGAQHQVTWQRGGQ